ncbi:SLATT domain-containing protein [Flavobacterium sufflavum]|uniref:SLATT domain-containing protein n=1 Tax=Flavobacterium sufflavum TaxID=1921138 RepID=A0A437KSF1_9FLAO|nr:SLATT domain-containing protein [Flavobacterium sufflavum]RVT74984.1 SLATT domain-containing protein [Flavobacterium sufflavum]
MIKEFLLYWKKIQRAKRIKKLKKKIPPYLQKDFEVELNYKLWSTKGARFAASHRSETLHRLSGQTVGYLSAYLIIVGLVNIYHLQFWMITLNDNQVNFASMSFSVLILLFSQLESSENFSLKSDRYHNCALDISELYDKLRYVKTYENNNPDKKDILKKISIDYDKILKRNENHKPIDYSKFQLTKAPYYELNLIDRTLIRTEYYWRVHFKYHLFMYGPIIIFLTINFYKIFYSKS